ncbi:hypothetical protein, partial [Vibrio nigripulchritudo]|uniref:hypothetical protein n=1 Tax=Vibrio nigripulchritudo TaxID=28173 RepID=UPI001E5AD8E7
SLNSVSKTGGADQCSSYFPIKRINPLTSLFNSGITFYDSSATFAVETIPLVSLAASDISIALLVYLAALQLDLLSELMKLMIVQR